MNRGSRSASDRLAGFVHFLASQSSSAILYKSFEQVYLPGPGNIVVRLSKLAQDEQRSKRAEQFIEDAQHSFNDNGSPLFDRFSMVNTTPQAPKKQRTKYVYANPIDLEDVR